MVLEVGTYTRAVGDDRDVELLQLVGRSYTTELEKLGRVVGSTSEDDFTRCLCRSGDSSCARGLGAGLVEVLAVKELNTNSAGRGDVLVEKNLCDVAVQSNVERVPLGAVCMLSIANGQDEFAGSSALATVGGEGDLVETRASIAFLGVGVGITSDESGKVDNSLGGIAKGKSSTTNEAEELRVAGDNVNGCVFGVEPALVAMGSRAGNKILVLLQLFEVLAHVGRRPRIIPSELLDVLKVRLVGIDSNESVVSCATSEGTSTGV